MDRNNFLTDHLSTPGGLAAVAYGSSTLFYSVLDQIKQNSITKDLDKHLPSQIILDFIGSRSAIEEVFNACFVEEYDKEEVFTDFIDVFCNGVSEFSKIYTDGFLNKLNKVSNYSYSLSDILEKSLYETVLIYSNQTDLEIDLPGITGSIIDKLESKGYLFEELYKAFAIAINNPTTKISSVPPDSIISLREEGFTTKNYRGVDRRVGTLTPQEYYSNKAYHLINGSIDQSVLQGYVDYPLSSLLGESLLSTGSFENYSPSAASSQEQLQDPIYNINLSTIDLSN